MVGPDRDYPSMWDSWPRISRGFRVIRLALGDILTAQHAKALTKFCCGIVQASLHMLPMAGRDHIPPLQTFHIGLLVEDMNDPAIRYDYDAWLFRSRAVQTALCGS